MGDCRHIRTGVAGEFQMMINDYLGHGASLLFLRRLLFVHLAMPLFHHRRDAVFAGFPVAVMSPAPATTPHERAQYTEEQEQEEQREQATQESKTETEWAIERWSVV